MSMKSSSFVKSLATIAIAGTMTIPFIFTPTPNNPAFAIPEKPKTKLSDKTEVLETKDLSKSINNLFEKELYLNELNEIEEDESLKTPTLFDQNGQPISDEQIKIPIVTTNLTSSDSSINSDILDEVSVENMNESDFQNFNNLNNEKKDLKTPNISGNENLGEVILSEIKADNNEKNNSEKDSNNEINKNNTEISNLDVNETFETLIWPGNDRSINSPYGPRLHPILKTMRPHTGIDVADGCGAPIKATASGVVTLTGYNSAYGNRIVVKHNNKIATTYNHLSSIKVKVGDRVSAGQTIGLEGTTGWSTGCHLHFEVIENGYFVNPLNYLNGKPTGNQDRYPIGNTLAAASSRPISGGTTGLTNNNSTNTTNNESTSNNQKTNTNEIKPPIIKDQTNAKTPVDNNGAKPINPKEPIRKDESTKEETKKPVEKVKEPVKETTTKPTQKPTSEPTETKKPIEEKTDNPSTPVEKPKTKEPVEEVTQPTVKEEPSPKQTEEPVRTKDESTTVKEPVKSHEEDVKAVKSEEKAIESKKQTEDKAPAPINEPTE